MATRRAARKTKAEPSPNEKPPGATAPTAPTGPESTSPPHTGAMLAYEMPPPTPKTEAIEVHPTPTGLPEPPAPPAKSALSQTVVEVLAVLLFLGLTLIPLARFGILPLAQRIQVTVLIVSSLVLGALIIWFVPAGIRPKGGSLEGQLKRANRAALVLHSLSIAASIAVMLILVVELLALLVYVNVVQSTSQAVVAAADNFVLFATLTLLLLDMLLIARTSFETKYQGKPWHPNAAYALMGSSALLLLLAFLKNLGTLNVGFFAGLKPEQSSYILQLAVFFQLVGAKLLLRYPPVFKIFLGELEAAKKANKEYQDILRKKATRAYVVAVLFVLLNILLLGGVSTGQVVTGNERTTNFLIGMYVTVGALILALLFTRYIQQQVILNREKRRLAGQPIATKRLTKEQINQIIVFSFSGFFALLFMILSLLTFLEKSGIKERYATDLLIMAFLTGVGPYGFRRALQVRRIHAIDDKFPDFLRDLAEGQRAGMTLPKALLTASKGVYGALTPEIRRMSAQVEWGVNFTESLQRFAKRVNTALITRTVALVTEASKAGGNTVDILTAASSDAREIKQILEERRRQMGIYSVIIYVAFFVFLAVIFVLASQFLPAFSEAVKGATGQQVGGLKFAAFSVERYKTIFFHAALLQGVGGGLVAGMMTEGHALGGLKHSAIMTIMSWVFFRILLG